MVKSNIIDHLKFEIIENTPEVRVRLNDHPFLIYENETIHSGVFSTLLDTTIGWTISNVLNGFALTINLQCFFFDLSKKKRYYCLAEVVNQNNNLITGEGKIIDEHGLVVAKGIGTFKLI